MTDENKERGFVVKDRRRFDSAGNEKSEVQEAAPKAEPVKAEPAKAQELPKREDIKEVPAYEADPNEVGPGEMNFSSFVMSLATQALMQLGEIKPPPGMTIDIDKGAARQSIDILGMLEVKTKNNLDKEEAHLLEQILHNLRLSYVKAVS